MRRQFFEAFLRENARHDSLHPARKVPRHVGNRFAIAQTRVGVIQKNGRAAQAAHAHFKCDARAQRRLFKNQRHEAAGQSASGSAPDAP